MLFINARFITQPTSGVQRFAESITARLLEQRSDVTLLAPSGARPRADGPLADAPVTSIGRLPGHLWEQVDLPRYLHKNGSPLLLGLTNTNPVRYHNMISSHHDVTYVRYPDSYSWKFRAVYSALTPRMLHNSKRIITVSAYSREELATVYGLDRSMIDVVHNATDFPTPPATSPSVFLTDSDAYFLSVSSQNRHKNLARLIDAFSEFRQATGSKTRLVLVGDRSTVFNGLGAEQEHICGVEFTGRVTDAELHRLYSQAKAFVFPSLHEGFGIPPIEAQAFGVPVLSSNAASLPEVLEESALYFDPTDTDSIATALARVDKDAALRDRLTTAGLVNVRRFSWRASADAVSAIVDSLNSTN